MPRQPRQEQLMKVKPVDFIEPLRSGRSDAPGSHVVYAPCTASLHRPHSLYNALFKCTTTISPCPCEKTSYGESYPGKSACPIALMLCARDSQVSISSDGAEKPLRRRGGDRVVRFGLQHDNATTLRRKTCVLGAVCQINQEVCKQSRLSCLKRSI